MVESSSPSNGWLEWSEQDNAQLGAQLGLAAPVPAVCLLLGEAGETWEHALADWELKGELPIINYLPRLPEKANRDFASARLMAAWLMHASELSDYLVTLDSSGLGSDRSLSCLPGEPIIIFQQPLTPSELIAEICGTPKAMAEDRVVHQVESSLCLRIWNPSDASILISLYNYSDEIEYALNSAESQSSLITRARHC